MDLASGGDGAQVTEAGAQDASVSDGLSPLSLKPIFTINGDPSSTHGYATILPGAKLTFASLTSCPATYSCTYVWDFGNGSQGSGVKPAPVTYSKAGLYRVSLKIKDSKGLLAGSAGGVVTVWNGKHADTFARSQVDWDKHLWLKPVDQKTTYAITGGWLNTKHNTGLPGSTAIASSPQCKETHLQVTLRRHPVASEEHYANILLRVHPAKRKGSYYRVQIKQGTKANGSELAVEVHKVTSDQNELGSSITTAPAVITGFDTARKQNIRLKVDLTDSLAGVPTFTVSAAAAANPSKVLLQLTGVKDSGGAPHGYAGFVGLSHYKGEIYFDDFTLNCTPVTTPGDAGVADASSGDMGALPDAGVPDAATPDQLVPDLPPPDLGVPPKVTTLIKINGAATGFATIMPKASLTFAAAVTCPAPYTCLYKWNFGNAKTGSGKAPAAVTYAKAGIFHVKLSVTSSSGYPMGSATAMVTVWNGTMSDTFNRAAMEWDKYLWIKPLNPKALFSIKSNMLLVSHNLKAPGSSAILAGPLVKDVHVEVTIKRSPLKTVVHYSDVILRMHPTKLAGSFYRVRIKEGLAIYNNEIDLEIFKIISASDEHGISLVSSPPTLSGFDPNRTTDIRVIIDLKDDAGGVPTFDVVFADAANTSKILLQLKALKDTNTTAPAHSYAGMVGLTQFDGQTSFDNFTMKPIAP